eukprot:Tbor_TRINITY_DN2818_c0_g1::TRINITY_DN2818_c0_g1_i1::g.23178::m.23178
MPPKRAQSSVATTNTTTHMRELVAEWHKLVAAKTEASVKLAEHREELAALKTEKQELEDNWNTTKESIQQTITGVSSAIHKSNVESDAMNKETQRLNERIADRTERNKDYRNIINKKRVALEALRHEIEGKEKDIRDALGKFRQSRDDIKAHLEGSINKISSVLLLKEKSSYENTVSTLKGRLEQINKISTREKRVFNEEVLRIDREGKVQDLIALRKELHDSQIGKDTFADILHRTSSHSSTFADGSAQIDRLRKMLVFSS